MSESLQHYGILRRSGRYPWGSGDNGYQRASGFLGDVEKWKKEGLTEKQIAENMGLSIRQLRAKISIENSQERRLNIAEAARLKEKGMSNVAIGERMGVNESVVRSWLKPSIQERMDVTANTAEMLAKNVADKKYIDIGVGSERLMGIHKTQLDTAVSMLVDDAKTHKIAYIKEEQLGTGKQTTIKALVTVDTPYSEVYKNRADIKLVNDYSEDLGKTFVGIEPIKNISSKRIAINYAEDGGTDKDGVIELRRGVDELSLGKSRYAQVRIGVDGTHYLKGMAIYADDLPDGVDIRFNTNKKNTGNKLDAMKDIKEDPENPFGALVRQKHYVDADGNTQLSPLNIVGTIGRDGVIKGGEEGEWGKWSKTISSQVLSKQSPDLAKRQLDLAYKTKLDEYDDIMALTNPAIKKRLLDSFADDCDSSAVKLKAAAMPGQMNHVILPLTSIKDTEVYAPNFKNGEKVVLVRHPHGGIFEIPELTVNNKNQEAKRLFPNAADAVGINPRVAERLSGADFDGDTVLVIPNPRGSIRTSPALTRLKGFDGKASYAPYDGMTTIDGGKWNAKTNKVEWSDGAKPNKKRMQDEMGKISNLITDMTIKGAEFDEIARAVKHSMVVIDSEKHHLDYKQSSIDNGIPELKKTYQGGVNRGASTLISKASSTEYVSNRRTIVDTQTGAKKYLYPGDEYQISTGETRVFKGNTYTNRSGEVVARKERSTKMFEVDDARVLSSGTAMEEIYAAHANQLKALGNQSRLSSLNTKPTPYSPSAKAAYSNEVQSLDTKLNVALKNAPRERQAVLLSNSIINAKKDANPDMDPSDLKKEKGRALTEARARVGAKKEQIKITDREWDAIQAGALSNNKVSSILNNTDLDALKQRAMPRQSAAISANKLALARARLASGYTQAEVAESLGISTTALVKALS